MHKETKCTNCKGTGKVYYQYESTCVYVASRCPICRGKGNTVS